MPTVHELKTNWQAAQAAADSAYASHLSANGQAAISWGGNGQIKGAAYTAMLAWREADRVADLAYAAYANSKGAKVQSVARLPLERKTSGHHLHPSATNEPRVLPGPCLHVSAAVPELDGLVRRRVAR